MLPTLRRRTSIDRPIDFFRDFDTMFPDVGRLFSEWASDEANGGLTGAYPVDIREEDGTLYVDAEMPGFSKDEIDVSLENGILSLTAERKEEEKKGKKHLHERRYQRVERRFNLPVDVDESNVKANFKDGVLHLEMPKSKEAQPKRITVS